MNTSKHRKGALVEVYVNGRLVWSHDYKEPQLHEDYYRLGFAPKKLKLAVASGMRKAAR